MKAFVMALLLAAQVLTVPGAAGVLKVLPDARLKLLNGDVVRLAGVRVTKRAPAVAFLKKFVEKKPVKFEVEPAQKGAGYLFVSASCDDVAKYLKEKALPQGPNCARSVFVNEVFLQQGWAKPALKNITLYKEKLESAVPAKKPPTKKAPGKAKRRH